MAKFKMIKTRVVAHCVVHREFPLMGIVADDAAPAAVFYDTGAMISSSVAGAIGLCGAPGEQERGT